MKHLIHCLGMSVPGAKVPVAVHLQLTCTICDTKLWQHSRDEKVEGNGRQSHLKKTKKLYRICATSRETWLLE